MRYTGPLPYAAEIVDADGCIESSTNADSVAEAAGWLRERGISMEQIEAVQRPDYCLFRYTRFA